MFLTNRYIYIKIKQQSKIQKQKTKATLSQINSSQSNLFKQDYQYESREKTASNFVRPLVANFRPSNMIFKDFAQEYQDNQIQKDSTLSTTQSLPTKHNAHSLPTSMNSAVHASLLQDSYSTRYSYVSSAKESSEDEYMHESNKSSLDK